MRSRRRKLYSLAEGLGEVGEKGVLVLGVLLGSWLEGLVGDESHIGAELCTRDHVSRQSEQGDCAERTIMRLLSVLFSNWGGPFHLRSCHFSSKSRRKYSFLRSRARMSASSACRAEEQKDYEKVVGAYCEIVIRVSASGGAGTTRVDDWKLTCHGPSKPERSVWQRPRACAPERATISSSLNPMR